MLDIHSFCNCVSLAVIASIVLLKSNLGYAQAKEMGGKELKVKLTVEYEVKPKHVLKLSLVNEGGEFECHKSDLPWRHWHSMSVLVAYPHGQVLKSPKWNDDPLVGTIKLKKGETLDGTIDLDRRYGYLTSTLKQSDLDLFWSFQLIDSGGHKSKRMGGWINLPREEP